MGRPPSAWLQRAYEFLADGEWHDREEVIDEMMKAVPRDMALRRGAATARAAVPDNELIRRGARHICMNTLGYAGHLESNQSLIRYHPVPRRLRFDESTRKEATHVLIPIAEYRALRKVVKGVEFVRQRNR